MKPSGLKFSIAILVLFGAWQFFAYAATITGPPSFGKYTSNGFVIKATKPNDTLNLSQELANYTHKSKFSNNSAYTAAHIRSVTPYGSHPAAGSNYQTQYNNQGSPAGASYARYSSGVSINQASSRYAHSQEWKGPDDDLQAYILGSGIMVLGAPYTDDFTITGWTITSQVVAGTLMTPFVFFATSAHTFDVGSLENGYSVIFRNHTSFTYLGYGCAFTARWNPPNRTLVRMVLTTNVKDVDGNSLLQPYSSPFVKYSTAGA